MKLFRGAVDTIKRVYRYEKTTGMDVGALQGVMLIFAVVLFLIDIENFRLGKYVIGIVTLVVGIVSVTAVFVIRRFQKVVLVCRIAVFLFLLLAAACFARSSPRFYHWLVTHPKLGPWIRDYLNGEGIPLKGKVYAIGLMWASIGLSCYLVPLLWARLFMLTSAILVTLYILRLNTLPPRH